MAKSTSANHDIPCARLKPQIWALGKNATAESLGIRISFGNESIHAERAGHAQIVRLHEADVWEEAERRLRARERQQFAQAAEP